MSKHSKQFSFVNIGLSSLLVVFLVLCLSTFSLLSLSSSKSDYSLSEKLADHRADYYEASAKAENIVAQLDALLEKNWKNNRGTYTASLSNGLKDYSLNDIDITFNTEDLTSEGYIGEISFSIPLDDRQILDVKLGITNPTTNSNYYEIITWQTNTELRDEMENTLDLLPMN